MTTMLCHLLLVGLLLTVTACLKQPARQTAAVDYYTCTMHPSVKAQDPQGKCPICGMDLVPVMKEKASATPEQTNPSAGERKIKYYKSTMMAGETRSQPGKDSMDMEMVPVYAESPGTDSRPKQFIVPVERQQQIGVTYAPVERKPLHHSIRALGTIQPDTSREWLFVARVEGYVQKLLVTSPGQIVDKDAPLMSIYSPDLVTGERELVQLLKMRDEATSPATRDTTAKLVEAAKRRLRQWNMTDEQIAALEKSRAPGETLTLLSPFRGVVQSVMVQQGRNVKIGDALAEVADLSVVWVWADFYESELAMLKQGQKTSVRSKSYPGETFEGEVALINPFLDETKHTSQVRIDIPNPDSKLRPGMYANVEWGMDMGEGLAIPVSAVMPTGKRNVVFVDKGEGKLEPRVVQLGGEFGEDYEVKEGVWEGERVVASANFLIDAESKVQGALKDFEGPETAKPEGQP